MSTHNICFPGKIRKILSVYSHSSRQCLSFNRTVLIFFLFLHENICCGYSLEAPWQGASNEYHNICFCGGVRKIFCGYPLLSGAMYSTHSYLEVPC